MPAKKKAQVGLEDRIVSNSELLALLEDRELMKEGVRSYRQKDKAVKAAIVELGEETPFRIGPYYIDKKRTEGRHVEFEVDPGSRIVINKVVD